MKYIVLIPSYEPNIKLIKLIDELNKDIFEVIVVNDGSNKSYDNIFKSIEKKCKVLSYDTNKGKGYALKYGLKYIKDNYQDGVIITMDSDGQHTVRDALNLGKIVSNEDNTILLGKRLRGKKTPLRSKIGNGITRFFFRITTGYDIYDTQTGLRAFKYEMIDYLLNVPGNRFDYEMNVLLDSSKNNVILKEEMIETIYEDNNSGSHFKTIRDSYLIYKQILKFLLCSVSSFIIDYLLYILLIKLGLSIYLSNISSRVVSASFNYYVNKVVVFKSHEKVSKSLIKYIMLACLILLINTLILGILTSLGVNKYLAKIIIEVILFLVNWVIQKRFIFKIIFYLLINKYRYDNNKLGRFI